MAVDVIHELGVIARAQSSHIHDLIDQLNCEPSDSTLYGYLDRNLDKAVLVRDLIVDLMGSIVDLEDE